MESYLKTIELRWSDLDPNFHLRHSVYYDYGAFCRISFLEEHGLPASLMEQLHFGPILFREEAVFRREIRWGDKLRMDIELTKSRQDFSRWSIRHRLIKNEDVLSAVISIDGAWINTSERKLATPPRQIADVFSKMPKSADFSFMP